jgi:hypothetical protein
MPPGIFGTRADLLVDSVLIFNCVAPVWAYVVGRMARSGDLDRHRKLQAILCAAGFVALFSLEGSIRLHGGSGSLIAGSPYAGSTLLKVIFLLHIGPAVATYLAWLWLTIKSWRTFKTDLPGSFSRRHKKVAWFVLGGLLWTAISALFVYGFGFAATGPA